VLLRLVIQGHLLDMKIQSAGGAIHKNLGAHFYDGRKMTFWAKLGSVVLVGFAVGFGARNYVEPSPDRVSAGLELFRNVCVPAVKHFDMTAELDRYGLVPTGVPQSWADPQSLFLLDLNAIECSVSDVLLQLNVEERTQFEAQAAALLAQEFPMLLPDESPVIGQWEIFERWIQYDDFDDRKWSVNLFRYSDVQGDMYELFEVSHTTLLVYLPQK